MKTDAELQSDVLDELKWEPAVTAAHIGVTARQGVVTLSGHVPSYGEKFAAERSTVKVYGVKAVANELEVKLHKDGARTDEDIAAACVNALGFNYSVPRNSVKTVVRDGWITLAGEVEWQYQKEAAERAVHYLMGVRGVTNTIALKPHLSAGDIKDRIEAALRRSAEVDARNIKVETSNSKVTLRGSVRSWTEREEAQHAAWAAPGVTHVDNVITVSP
jgi:osmotically-inducible protein OsmY